MKIDLDKIRVKPVTDYFEQADVETVMSRCHPLGYKKAIGRRISYVATQQGVWLSALVFDKAVDRNKHRKAKIGWSASQEEERRKHIANNSRFVILPKFAGEKNLASKILSLICERISSDWKKLYGIPLLAVETYVDPEYNNNDGACYKASGWENLGYSTGHIHENGERTHSKWYFLKPLHKNSFAALSCDIPHALITGVKEVNKGSNNNYVLDASKISLKDLQKDLEHITDPRRRQGRRYEFVPLLSLCISAVVSGYTQYRQIADWIARLPSEDRVKFGMPGDRTPDESTIGKLLRKIDPIELRGVLTRWLLKTYGENAKMETVSLDGKALRATSSDTSEQKAFLNVFASDIGIVIDHVPTKKGAGEKASARSVLDNNELLRNKVVLADAIHTDKKFLESVEKKTPRMSSLSKAIKAL